MSKLVAGCMVAALVGDRIRLGLLDDRPHVRLFQVETGIGPVTDVPTIVGLMRVSMTTVGLVAGMATQVKPPLVMILPLICCTALT